MLNNISQVKFWCHKILPLVYDDSLSYYEAICKFNAKLTEVINNMNEIPNYIKELINTEVLETLLIGVIDGLRENIASANEGTSTTATATREVDDLVWLNGELYRIIRPMFAGDRYVQGSNCIKTTVEEALHFFISNIKQVIRYVEAEEKIVLSETITVSDGSHTYDASNTSMVIQ